MKFWWCAREKNQRSGRPAHKEKLTRDPWLNFQNTSQAPRLHAANTDDAATNLPHSVTTATPHLHAANTDDATANLPHSGTKSTPLFCIPPSIDNAVSAMQHHQNDLRQIISGEGMNCHMGKAPRRQGTSE